MAQDPADRLAREKQRIRDAESISETTVDRTLSCIDDQNIATSTCTSYLKCLRKMWAWSDDDVSTLEKQQLPSLIENYIAEQEYAESTVPVYESAGKAFIAYQWSDDEAEQLVDVTVTRSDSSVDPRTVLAPEDHHAIRDAADNDRDRALVDFLAYTGQRLRVVQSLELEDVDVENGVWYMPDAEGLKGADEVGMKRPLLGARTAVREWYNSHPTGDPKDAFFTGRPIGSPATPGDELGASTIRGILSRLADHAGVEKPVNPHAWRHYFVTVAKTQYELDDGTIKHLIGHKPSSTIMETTYAHLSDDDHIAAARDAMGLSDEDEEKSMAPPICPTCSRPLAPYHRSCPTPTCSEVFAPEATETTGLAQEVERDPELREALMAELEKME
jgi:integrase